MRAGFGDGDEVVSLFPRRGGMGIRYIHIWNIIYHMDRPLVSSDIVSQMA